MFIQVRLELMTDREMHEVMNKGVRGGMCYISHKHAAANNPYMGEMYDASKPTAYICYLDMWVAQQRQRY